METNQNTLQSPNTDQGLAGPAVSRLFSQKIQQHRFIPFKGWWLLQQKSEPVEITKCRGRPSPQSWAITFQTDIKKKKSIQEYNHDPFGLQCCSEIFMTQKFLSCRCCLESPLTKWRKMCEMGNLTQCVNIS